MERYDPAIIASLMGPLWAYTWPETSAPPPGDSVLDSVIIEAIRPQFVLWDKQCTALGLGASRMSVLRIANFLNAEQPTYGHLRSLAEQLYDRIRDELQAKLFLHIPLPDSDYYQNPLREWDPIVQRFPQTIGDAEEASKCYALERYAAAVFHCMQVVEATLIELGRFIRVPKGNKPSWGATTGHLGIILQKKPEQLTAFERKNLEKLRQVHAVAQALQHAWRNKISHAGERLVLLTPDFNREIANDIMVASQAFARRLATDLPARKKLA